jgi:hypothetical protein
MAFPAKNMPDIPCGRVTGGFLLYGGVSAACYAAARGKTERRKKAMILKEQKKLVIEANRTHPTDTGSPEVQIAILTERNHAADGASPAASEGQSLPPRPVPDDRQTAQPVGLSGEEGY